MSSTYQLPRASRPRRNSTSPSVSSDDAPRSPPQLGLSPVKDNALAATPSVMSNVHREWQKLRYSRRSAASGEAGFATPPSERTSPTLTPIVNGAAPRPSFMSWSAQSPISQPSRPQTFVSPLAEWALGGRSGRSE